MKDMKIVRYKPGEQIFSFTTKNNDYQSYFADKLIYKGYYNKYGKFIGYKEDYRDFMNKGIKYIL